MLRKLLLACLLAGASATAFAQDFLVSRPAFRTCEREAFIALMIARNGMHFNDTRESLLANQSSGEPQIAMINELFDEIGRTGSKDHAGFAARQFYQCAKRERLALTENFAGATVCLARHDIVFFITIDRNKGVPQTESLARIRSLLGNSAVYPVALVEQLVPMTYRLTSADEDFMLRRLIFESCLFPDDWKAWYEATQRGK
jgi:hypothetical protein